MTFNTSHKKGHQKKTVTVESNDPVNPLVRLHLTAMVEVAFDFESSNMRFYNIKKGTGETKSAFLIIKDMQKTKIDSVVSSSPYILAKLVKNEKAEKAHKKELQITLKPGMPLGNINETVIVYSNLPDNPKKILRISGNIIGDVEVRPASINFIISDSNTIVNRAIQNINILNHATSKPLKILEIVDDRQILTLTKKTIEDGKKYVVEVTPKMSKLKDIDRMHGQIKIRTNCAEKKEYIVRYNLIRQNPKKKK